jgi:hypothetical protein
MTEAEWDRCTPTDLGRMLAFLSGGKATQRKVWLFACACCRGAWPLLIDPRSRTAVEVAERYGDGLAAVDELELARRAAQEAVAESGQIRALSAMAHRVAGGERGGNPWPAAARVGSDLFEATWRVERFHFTKGMTDRQGRELFDVRGILRDIVGPLPFRPLSIDRGLTERNEGDVRKLAQAIYDGRDFGCLPILADALEDAGLDNAEVLGHCREPGRHCRGCWVVDLVLGNR